MNKVFVLTKDPLFLDSLTQFTRKNEDILAVTFSNNLEMLNRFLSDYAPLVILDIDLVKKDTFHMIQILHSIHRKTKIVLVVSTDDMPICTASLAYGVLSYQIKPVSPQSISELITKISQISIPPN